MIISSKLPSHPCTTAITSRSRSHQFNAQRALQALLCRLLVVCGAQGDLVAARVRRPGGAASRAGDREAGAGARRDSARGDFTRQIRAFRISLHRYNAACLSLTPHLSGVWAMVLASEPLQRFTHHRKPLKRLGSWYACHSHLAEVRPDGAGIGEMRR